MILYRAHVACLSSNRWGAANLDWLIQNGKGKKPVTEARSRCRDCGKMVESSLFSRIDILTILSVHYLSVAN